MSKFFLTLQATLVVLLIALTAKAQIQTPLPSPSAKFTQTVGMTDISVEYFRPSARGRAIYGGLVPFDKVWRTGANYATTISFSEDVKVAGTELKAGKYAILTIPGKSSWKINFYPFDKTSWTSYREQTPELIVAAKPETLAAMVETFTIDVNNLNANKADLRMLWEKTQISIPIEVNYDDRVMLNINTVLAGPTQDDYFRAATYYHENGKDLKKALEYINKAVRSDDTPKFWQVRRKALILADLGKKKEAIDAAKLSLSLAEKAGNADYVRLNKASIEEWSRK